MKDCDFDFWPFDCLTSLDEYGILWRLSCILVEFGRIRDCGGSLLCPSVLSGGQEDAGVISSTRKRRKNYIEKDKLVRTISRIAK